MRILAVSDIHIDYKSNHDWLHALSETEYSDDILILAGDISGKITQIEHCFKKLARCFNKVIYVPGNHDLWVMQENFSHSLLKYERICELAAEEGILMNTYRNDKLSIVPLQSWYDFSFGPPGDDLLVAWADFRHCVWPADYTEALVSNHFLEKNQHTLNERNEVVISCSHFLPSLSVLSERIPERFSFLHPVLGSAELGRQLDVLKPDIHIYGHSHVNQNKSINGIRYINNAIGYPHETWTSSKLQEVLVV